MPNDNKNNLQDNRSKGNGPQKGNGHQNERKRRYIRLMWKIFWIGVVAFNVLIIAANVGLLGYMPSMKELENPSSALSSEVYASDGSLLTRYYVQDRSSSKYEEVSPNVYNALLATEDARFYEHSGIDPIATVAIPFYILTGKKRGSSTITQQLAKNLFPRENQNFLTLPFIKLKEWIMAVKLERNLTKNEILILYLNTVPYSDNVYGIRNASQTFYNKMPDSLAVDEAAVLVGMLKGNTIYNPRRNPERALERRNVILSQMAEQNFITESEAATLSKKPIALNYHKIDHHEGLAPYFRQVLEQELKRITKDLKKEDGTPYNIYKDGLKIYTTIDPTMQRYAEEAVDKHLSELQKLFFAQPSYKNGAIWEKNKQYLLEAIKSTERYEVLKEEGKSHEQIMRELRKPVKMRVFAWNKQRSKDTTMSPIDSIKYMKMFLQAGFMAMDPFTGQIKAWVGGIDHNYFQYDHVNINTKRQVGSTIKPLLYTLAVDNGFSPCSMVSTMPQDFPEKKGYDAGGTEYGGQVPMSVALAKSINNASLYLIKQVGVSAFVDFVHKCGINSDVEKYASSALGASDISLYEMLWSYTMFPSGGINVQPMFITKIEDKNGVLLKSFVPAQKEIISPNTAYKMVKLMRGVVDFGTAVRIRSMYGFTEDIAGKTGTTNKHADAWFIGYTPQILAGVWVGCNDRYLRFTSMSLGQGSASALPIWANFMKRVYANKSLDIRKDVRFKQPDGFDDCGAVDPTSLQRSTYYENGFQDSADINVEGQPKRTDTARTRRYNVPLPEESIEEVPLSEWE